MNTNDEKTPAAPHSSGYPGGYGPQEDEIDLADLIAVLYRRRRLIVVVTLIFALATAGMVTGRRLVLPQKYTASTIIEVGQLYVGNSDKGSDYEKVESLSSSEDRIKDLAKVIYRKKQVNPAKKDKSQNPGFSLEDDFKVSYSENGSVMELELEAYRGSNALSFLERVADAFIDKHKHIFDRRKVQLENTIQDLNASVESQLSKKSLIKKKLNLLENEKEKLKQSIEQANENYDRVMSSKLNANGSSKGPGAVSLLLFNSEIHQIRSYVDELESRLWFTIPEKQNELETELENIDLQLEKMKRSITLEKMELNQLKAEQEDEIKSIQQTIRNKERQKENNQLDLKENQSALANMMTTRVLLPAQFSDEPANAVSLKLAVVLGLFAGLFIGIFSAFLMEFWKNNKQKISSN